METLRIKSPIFIFFTNKITNFILSKYAITPSEIESFVNYPSEINKTSITPLKLHNVNQFISSVKFFC